RSYTPTLPRFESSMEHQCSDFQSSHIFAAPSRTGRSCLSLTLQHLKYLERPSASVSRAYGNRADAVQPAVLLRACLEVRSGAEIVSLRIDGLATIETIDQLLRAVAQGFPVHVDLLLVISFEGDPRLYLQHVVAAH